MNNQISLVDEFLQLLGENQYLILILVLSVLLSPFVLLIFLLNLLILQRVKYLKLPVMLVSGCMLVILIMKGYWLPGFGILTRYFIFHQISVINAQEFMHEFFYSIPVGVFFGSLASIIGAGPPLGEDLKRIGQGLHLDHKAQSDRVLQKALIKLSNNQIENGSILGIDKITLEKVVLTDQDANLHVLAIGTTGSGKTTTIANMVESAISRQLPVFYIDGKGDLPLARRVRQYANACGRKFYLFSMVGESCTYNPISTGGFTSKKDRIIELRNWSEEHYKKLAESYLQTVLKILDSIGYEVNLVNLTKALKLDELTRIIRQHQRQDLVQSIAYLESIYKNIEGVIAELNNLVESEIGRLFITDDSSLSLSKAFDENAVVYFCLQPLQFPSYAETLGKLIINDLKSLFSTQLNFESPQKSYVFFDEFSVFAGDQIINLINQGRSAGVHAVLATQSISDLERKGGKAFVGQVLNNCNNYIIQRQNNPSDAEILANVIGTKKVFEVTSQISIDYQASVGTVKEVNEFIYHPDVLKNLAMGEAVLLTKQSQKIQEILVRKGVLA